MRLLVATRNEGKTAEIAALLSEDGIEVQSLVSVPNMPEIIEDGETFKANALKKARETCAFTGLPALADDSGLVVDALDGEPGVRSARFAPTTEERNAKLLGLLESVPDEQRTARFICALALVRPDGFEWTSEGVCEGIITHEPSGEGGFGYDPVFFYPPLDRTFADIPRTEKNLISHRGRALAAFRTAIEQEGILG